MMAPRRVAAETKIRIDSRRKTARLTASEASVGHEFCAIAERSATVGRSAGAEMRLRSMWALCLTNSAQVSGADSNVAKIPGPNPPADAATRTARKWKAKGREFGIQMSRAIRIAVPAKTASKAMP